jgi:hypothetical protein
MTDTQLNAALYAYEEEYKVWSIIELPCYHPRDITWFRVTDFHRLRMITDAEPEASSDSFHCYDVKSMKEAHRFIHEEAMKVALTAALNTRT